MNTGFQWGSVGGTVFLARARSIIRRHHGTRPRHAFRRLRNRRADRRRRNGRGVSRHATPTLGRQVAIKVLPDAFAADPDASRGSNARRRRSPR